MAQIAKICSINQKLLFRNYSYLMHKTKVKTAGIIVIGDEILCGDVLDTNSNYISKTLHNLGVKVEKISVVGDDIPEISEETLEFSDRFNYVITTGGIGPTHDDVTFEAIGKAFNEELVPHPKLVEICSKYYQTNDLKAPGMKLAFIPQSAKLTFAPKHKVGMKMNYPNISINNVYIFPGIPQLLQKSLDALGAELFASETKFYKRHVYFNVTEQLVVNALNQLVKEFPDVTFGSYPELLNRNYKVKVTIKSMDEDSTSAAAKKLMQLVPKDFLVR